uniref:Uncharacterized protein n=1 Tax=Romanomermis culicivorax TaxID=13658 RepID=A0A915HYF1_ROMCU
MTLPPLLRLQDFLREIRRASSPQRAASRRDRSADAANARMFVFGSSTPRELSYLERVPHEFRLIDAVTPGKFLTTAAASGHGSGGGFSQEKRSKTTHNFTNLSQKNAHANASACGEKIAGAGAASKAKAKVQYLNRRSSSISSTSNENTLSTPPKVTFSTPNGDHPERKSQNGTASANRSSRPRSARTRSVPATIPIACLIFYPAFSIENERMSRDISKKTKEITTKLFTQKTQRKKTPAKAPGASIPDKAKIIKINVENEKIEPKSPSFITQSSPEPLSKTDDEELTFSSPEPPKLVAGSLESDHVTMMSRNITDSPTVGDQLNRNIHALQYQPSTFLDEDTPSFEQTIPKHQEQIFPDEFMISNQSKVPQVEDFHSIPRKLETTATEHIVKEGFSGNEISEKLSEIIPKWVDDSKVDGQAQISEENKINGKSTILEINHCTSMHAEPDFLEKIKEVSFLSRVDSPTIVVYEEREPQVQDENVVEYPSDDSGINAAEPMLEDARSMEKYANVECHAEKNQDQSRNLESFSLETQQLINDENHMPVGVLKMNSDILNLKDSTVEQKMTEQVQDPITVDVHPNGEVGVQEMDNYSSILHENVLDPVPVLEKVAQFHMETGKPQLNINQKVRNLEHPIISLHNEEFESLPVHVHDQIFEGMHPGLEKQVEDLLPHVPVDNQTHIEPALMSYKVDHSEQYEYHHEYEDKAHAIGAQDHIPPVDKAGESTSPLTEKSMSIKPQLLKSETELMPAHQQPESFGGRHYDQETPDHTAREFQCLAGDLIRAPSGLYNEDTESVDIDHLEGYEHRYHIEDQVTVDHERERHVHPIAELRKVDSLNDAVMSLEKRDFESIHEFRHLERDQILLVGSTPDEPEVPTPTSHDTMEAYSKSEPMAPEDSEDNHYGSEHQITVMESDSKQDVHHEREEHGNTVAQDQFESPEFIMEEVQRKHPAGGDQEKPVQDDVERLIFATSFMENDGYSEYISEIEQQAGSIQMASPLEQSPQKLENEMEEYVQSKVENFNQLVPCLLKKDLELAQEESTVFALEPLTLASEMVAKNQDLDGMPSALSAPEVPSPHAKTPTHTPTSASAVHMEEDILPQLLKKNFAFLDEEQYVPSEVESVRNGSHLHEINLGSTPSCTDQAEQRKMSFEGLSQHQYIVEEPATPKNVDAAVVDGQFFEHMAHNVVEDSIQEAKKYVSDSNLHVTEVKILPNFDDFDQEKHIYSHAYDDEDSDQSGLELEEYEDVTSHNNNLDDLDKPQSNKLPLQDQVQAEKEIKLENVRVQDQAAERSPRSFDTADQLVTTIIQDEDHGIQESDDSGIQDIYIYSLQKYEDNLDKLDHQPETTLTIVDPQVFDKRFQYGEDFFAPNVVAQSFMSPKRDNELLEKSQDFDDQSTKSHESLIKDYSHDFCDNSSSSSVSVVVASTKGECGTKKKQDFDSSPRNFEGEDYPENQSFDKGFETDDERGVWKKMMLNESDVGEKMDLTADETTIPFSSVGFDTKQSEMERFYTRIEKSEPMAQKCGGIVVEPDHVEISVDNSTFRPYHEESIFPHAHTNGKSAQILDTFSQFLPSSSEDDHFTACPTSAPCLDESFSAGILKKQSSSNLGSNNDKNYNNNNEFYFSGGIETDDDSSPINFSKIDFNDSSTSPPSMTSPPKTTSMSMAATSKSEEQQQKKIFRFRSEETSSEEDDDESNGNITVEFQKFLQNTENVDLPEVQFKKIDSKFRENENQSRI